MTSLYALYEHDGTRPQQADMARIMASPAITGICARIRNADLCNGDATDVRAAFDAAAGKPVRLCVSPQPGTGTPSVTVGGEAYALPTDELFAAVEQGAQFLAQTVRTYPNAISARLCFMAPGDGDCEQGLPPGDMHPWIDAGLTNAGILAFATKHAAMMAGLFPGAEFSLSLFEPRHWTLQDDGTIGRRGSTFGARLFAAVRAGLGGARLVAFNTNYSADLPDAALAFTQGMAVDGLGLQLKDMPAGPVVNTAIADAAALADEIEAHQVQLTDAVLAGLGG